METLWRIIRRLIFLIVTVFVSANTIGYLILNNAFVHDWFRDQANHYLESNHLEIFIGPITVNFLETTLTVSQIRLTDLNGDKRDLANVGRVVVGFDPWSLNRYWLPALKFVNVEDWKFDLQVASRLDIDKASEEQRERSIAEILDLAYSYVGRQIDLKNGQLIKSEDSDLETDIKINRLFLKFDIGNSKKGLTLLGDIGQSFVCISEDSPCTKKVLIESAEINGEMSGDGTARLERVGLRSGYGDWQMAGQVRFGKNFKVENYNLKLDGSADATSWFHLAGMQGGGNFKLGVFLNPEGGSDSKDTHMKNLTPSVHGQIAWNALKLSGFDIYTGAADVQYSNHVINYKNAVITTPAGAVIESRGEYSLKEKMQFINTARIRQFPFTEMMSGIRVPSEAINFQMNTRELLVSGLLNSGDASGYKLVISGTVETSRMKVSSFEPNKRLLPDCQVELRISSDIRSMSFAGSRAKCEGEKQEKSSSISLSTGIIDYSKSTNDFRFHINAAPASMISYFVDENIEGEVNLVGSIYASPLTPVSFKSDVQINSASAFDLNIPRIGGQLIIDAKGLRARNVEAWLEDEEQKPALIASNIFVGFSNHKIELDGSIDGELRNVLKILGEKGRALASQTQGRLSISRLSLRGNTKDILKSNLDLRLSVKNLYHSFLSASDAQAFFACQNGWCSGSRLFLKNLSIGEGGLKMLTNGTAAAAGLPLSKAIFEIDSISEKSLSARVELQSVPMRFSSDGHEVFSGVGDLRGILQGGMKDWEVSAHGRVDRPSLAGTPIGALSVAASSHSGGPLNVIISGFFDQIQSRFIFDHGFEKSTQAFLSFRSFEIFKYLPFLQQRSFKLSGSMSTDLSLEAPGLKTLFRNRSNLTDLIDGEGQVSKIRLQMGRESISLASPVRLKIGDGVMSYSSLTMAGAPGRVQSEGQYSFVSGQFKTRLDAKLDAGILSQMTDLVSQSGGDVVIKGEIERSEDGTSIRGDARIENVNIGGKFISPPLTSMNGRLIFQDSRIEIPSMTASKGNGQVDVVGTVDLLSETDEGLGGAPNVALRANLKSAQFRWPQELFETVETTIDGQLDFVGSGRPYSLNGDVKIVKGRAYRDATCQELIRSGPSSSDSSIAKPQIPLLRMNLGIEADNSFTLQSNCIRGRVSTSVRLTGTDLEPILSGQMRLDNGVLNLLKTRFDVTRADATFDNIVKIEPRLDAQMVARIDKYSVFVGAEGPLSKPRLNIWSDPSTGPDGTPLSRPALIRMISTGRGPAETTQTAVRQAIANQVVGLFDDPLSQAVSKITRGFVDRFELQPIVEGGQSSLRARASRDLGEKFNLGLDYEPNRQSLTGTIYINESVNVLGGFDRRSSQLGSYSELSGGLRFQFGGK